MNVLLLLDSNWWEAILLSCLIFVFSGRFSQRRYFFLSTPGVLFDTKRSHSSSPTFVSRLFRSSPSLCLWITIEFFALCTQLSLPAANAICACMLDAQLLPVIGMALGSDYSSVLQTLLLHRATAKSYWIAISAPNKFLGAAKLYLASASHGFVYSSRSNVFWCFSCLSSLHFVHTYPVTFSHWFLSFLWIVSLLSCQVCACMYVYFCVWEKAQYLS